MKFFAVSCLLAMILVSQALPIVDEEIKSNEKTREVLNTNTDVIKGSLVDDKVVADKSKRGDGIIKEEKRDDMMEKRISEEEHQAKRDEEHEKEDNKEEKEEKRDSLLPIVIPIVIETTSTSTIKPVEEETTILEKEAETTTLLKENEELSTLRDELTTLKQEETTTLKEELTTIAEVEKKEDEDVKVVIKPVIIEVETTTPIKVVAEENKGAKREDIIKTDIVETTTLPKEEIDTTTTTTLAPSTTLAVEKLSEDKAVISKKDINENKHNEREVIVKDETKPVERRDVPLNKFKFKRAVVVKENIKHLKRESEIIKGDAKPVERRNTMIKNKF